MPHPMPTKSDLTSLTPAEQFVKYRTQRPQARPGLSAAAVTVAAFACCRARLANVHETAVVALYPTSGVTCAEQAPRTRFDTESRMANVTVDRAAAAGIPRRFVRRAATPHS